MSSKENIKRFEDYEIEEFLSDEFFVQWVKNPDENTTHFWEKWLVANPGKRPLVTEAAAVVRSIRYSPESALSDEDYVELFENIIRAEEGLREEPGNRGEKEGKWYSFFSVRRAAAFFLLGLAAWAIYASWPRSETVQPEVRWITKVNPKGQKTSVRLKDGTLIHLNSKTILAYPEDFSETQREVRLLSGEAFFDVEKESRPFKVLLPSAEVEVLGTDFNVKQNGDRQLSVALVEGSVKVKDTLGNQVMLVPSEMLQIDENGNLNKSNFDVREITGWKDKYLVFKNDDFAAVVQKLENWYGVDIRFEGELPKGWAYSGIYFDESLANTLEGISQTSQIKYSIQEKQVKITGKK
ncbi:FecR domain-containing protein [Algoriphagus sp. H41]|uniref:FecR domain-containing protein n=1 Tax=Algoriphagus oliviformis TaxID=2811231 RepID=A0ABS3BYM7_9BACT|nr:FecR family protein [Algoriphagus oliviformis]MBN7809960.1 FecR domain-containing protein [Algoriphagus oliviformis]